MKIRSWWMRSFFATVNVSLAMNLGGCKVGDGDGLEFNIIPKKPTEVTDNANDDQYTYDNKKYIYNEKGYRDAYVDILTLVSQYIRNNIQNNNNLSPIWTKFINTDPWKKESFKNISYDIPDKPGTNGFTAKFSGCPILIEPEQNDDFSNENKLVKYYVMIPSLTPWQKGNPFNPDVNALQIPTITNNNETKTVTGYLYSYANIGKFKLEFSIQWDFIFKRIEDKKGVAKNFLTKASRHPINNNVNTPLDTIYQNKIKNLFISEDN